MTIVDSVGWLAFFKGEALAAQYRPYLRQADLLCPTIIVYEVCGRIELDAGRQAAATVAAQLLKTRVIPLDEALATASRWRTPSSTRPRSPSKQRWSRAMPISRDSRS